ncbi:hypothetical protein [Paenibacillus faecalis]|uniref:hypothetical protein n=1 Tax=Paenibacillus faecalis TaxID=2079532 RepID=UPI000D10B1CC|nr:hypothetical protein [Paenibacillus faecalis]
MRYVDWLQGLIGSEVEIMISDDVVVGTLTDIYEGMIILKVPLIIDGPPSDTATIPLHSVEFIRIVSS